MENQEKTFILWLGRIASVIAVLMYVSYIAQIQKNLAGVKADLCNPLWRGSTVRFGAFMPSLSGTGTGLSFGLTSRGFSSALPLLPLVSNFFAAAGGRRRFFFCKTC